MLLAKNKPLEFDLISVDSKFHWLNHHSYIAFWDFLLALLLTSCVAVG